MLNMVNLGNEQVEHLGVLLYGSPGVGKTSLALTSNNSITLDFDNGSHRALHKAGKMGVVVRNWKQVNSIEPSDLEGIDTVILDTIGTCVESIILDLVENHSQLVTGGVPTLKGWQALRVGFNAWANKMKSAGIDVIMIGHLSEDSKGDDVVDRVYCQGGAKQDVYRQADLIGKVFVNHNGQRVVSFNPTRTSLGKNCGLPDLTINPDVEDSMAKIIAKAKELINNRNAQQAQEAERLKDLKTKLMGMDAEALTDQVTQMHDASKVDKNILMEVAAKKGLTLDKDTMMFVEEVATDEQAAS